MRNIKEHNKVRIMLLDNYKIMHCGSIETGNGMYVLLAKGGQSLSEPYTDRLSIHSGEGVHAIWTKEG